MINKFKTMTNLEKVRRKRKILIAFGLFLKIRDMSNNYMKSTRNSMGMSSISEKNDRWFMITCGH